MHKLENNENVFLMPGEFFWGGEHNKVTTVLGSCVSICLWHPEKKIGGICHFRLPGRRIKRRLTYNTSYGDDVVWLLLDKIKQHQTQASDYIVKVFGGADMFSHTFKYPEKTVGKQNVQSAVSRLHQYGFSIKLKHIHGNKPRKIVFDLFTGAVSLYCGSGRDYEIF